MRQGSLIRDLAIIVESLYKGRMRAIRFGEVEIRSQDQITADGTNACMYCIRMYGTIVHSLHPNRSTEMRVLPRLSHSCGNKAWSFSQGEKKKKKRINPFSLA